MTTQKSFKTKKVTKPIKESTSRVSTTKRKSLSGDAVIATVKPKARETLVQSKEKSGNGETRIEGKPQSRVRRVSFIIRLTLNKHNEIQRAEIEHVESKKKQNFPALEIERLADFMKAYTSTEVSPETPDFILSTQSKVSNSTLQLQRPRSDIVVTTVEVFQMEQHNSIAFPPTVEKSLLVQTHFLIRGADARFLTDRETLFTVKLIAKEIPTGLTQILMTKSAKMIQNIMEYMIPASFPNLAPGLYRLLAMITLDSPYRLGGFNNNTIFRVV